MIGAVETRMVAVSDMNPASYNPRKDLTPSDALYKKLKKSIDEVGYIAPIVWNEATGHIVGGHQRYKVLVEQGVDQIEVTVVNIADETEEKRLNIELNKAVGDWDFPALADILKGMQEAGYDVEQTGYEIPEIDDLFSKVYDRTVAEDVPVKESEGFKPFVGEGDLWCLGKHRLICDRPDDPKALKRLMDEKKAHLLLAAPAMEDADIAAGTLQACAQALVKGASVYIIHDDRQSLEWRQAFKAAGFHLSGVCAWLHSFQRDIGTGYLNAHTPVLFGWASGGNHRWFADRKQTTVWTADAEDGLPTVRLMAYPIKNSTAPRHTVLAVNDHNGSALMACEETDRRCRMVVEDPAEASRIVQRYERSYGAESIGIVEDGIFVPLPTVKRQRGR